MKLELSDKTDIIVEADFFSPDEVCKLFRIERSTLRMWTMLNKIPHIKLTRKTLLFPKITIMEFLAQRLVGMEPLRVTETKLPKPEPAAKSPKPKTVKPVITGGNTIYDSMFTRIKGEAMKKHKKEGDEME